MHTSDYERTIEHQFDSFCKIVLRNHARNIYTETKRRNERLISLELLTPAQWNQLSILDDYDSDYICFFTHNFDIQVNADIATLMNLAESTVHYHKNNALNELKKFLEEHLNEN